MGRAPSQPPERVSANDLTVLATDHGPVPMNIGAALVLEEGERLDPDWLTDLLAARVHRVPRLRQRLVRAPRACGRPVWVDDRSFSLARHLCTARATTDAELMDVLSLAVCTPLDRDAPLWRACLVTGLPEGRSAVVLVLHHVLADGMGGLALLAALADQVPSSSEGSAPGQGDEDPFPRPAPGVRTLALDAAHDRLQRFRGLPGALARGAQGLHELGLAQRPHLAERTTLTAPTGGTRRLSSVSIPLRDVLRAAHRAGGTVNDVVLTAVVGALSDTLSLRGEHPGHLVVSVPVSARPAADVTHLGNAVGVHPVAVPTLADHHERLTAVVQATRSTGSRSRASSAGPLGAGFRVLARLGLFQVFIDHQPLVHTFATNLRGPGEPAVLGGHRIQRIVPAAVNPGNVAVSFTTLSYAGELGVTVVADPSVLPEQERLTRVLGETLRVLVHPPAPPLAAGEASRAPARTPGSSLRGPEGTSTRDVDPPT